CRPRIIPIRNAHTDLDLAATSDPGYDDRRFQRREHQHGDRGVGVFSLGTAVPAWKAGESLPHALTRKEKRRSASWILHGLICRRSQQKVTARPIAGVASPGLQRVMMELLKIRKGFSRSMPHLRPGTSVIEFGHEKAPGKTRSDHGWNQRHRTRNGSAVHRR